jgi:hypothetical protein
MLKKLFTPLAILFATFLFMGASDGQAVLFSTDITATGSAAFDEGFASSTFGAVTQTGDFGVTEAGVETKSTFSGATATGANPVPGTLTDIGDGVGASADIDALFDAAGAGVSEFEMAIDLGIDLKNTSGTKDYLVTIKVTFSNDVDADGADSFADSEFTVDDDGGEVFFSDLISDTTFGDEVGGALTGTFGDPQSDSGDFFFDVTLTPSDTVSLVAVFLVDGGVFEDPGLAKVDFSAFISIDAVVDITDPGPGPDPQVPEPATMLLFGTGLLGLGAIRRRRTKRG